MKKSVAKNYLYNLFYQILNIIVPLFTTPYLSRVLGAESIGIYSYTLSIATYFILFGSLGVAMYGQREIAYVQEDKEKRSKIFFEIVIMRFITLGFSLFIFYLSFCSKGDYRVYYKILILEMVANILDISWFFQGLEEFKKTVIRNTVVKLASIICIFTFIKSANDLSKYFLIYVLSNLIGNISLWMYLPKYLKKIRLTELKMVRHLKPTLVLFIPQLATQLYTVLDKTMIGSIVSDKSEVGFYEQAQKLVKLFLTIATSLGTVMVPRMASVFASGKQEKLKEYMKKSFHFILLITFPLMFWIISIANKFVPIFYGEGYDKVKYLIIIISPILLLIGLSNVIGMQYLLPTKQQKKYTISVVLGAITNFVLNLILIYLWQSVGASIATVLAEGVVTGVQFYLVRKEISIKDVISISKNYFLAAIVMFFVSIGIGAIIANPIISIMMQTLLGGIVYLVVLAVRRDKMFLEGIQLGKKKLDKEK